MRSQIALLVLLVLSVDSQFSTDTTTESTVATTPRESCTPEVSAQCPPEDGSDLIIFEDPDDCSAFCQCSAGIAYKKHCQDGTYYDDVSRVCNWPNMVDCGDRPIPGEVSTQEAYRRL